MFHINAETLLPLEDLPYLGRMITYNNREWPAVFQNLKKVRRRWGMILRVLTKTVETVQVHGMMYKTVVQSVLLYYSESRVVMGAMLKVLEKITRMTSKCVLDREW